MIITCSEHFSKYLINNFLIYKKIKDNFSSFVINCFLIRSFGFPVNHAANLFVSLILLIFGRGLSLHQYIHVLGIEKDKILPGNLFFMAKCT